MNSFKILVVVTTGQDHPALSTEVISFRTMEEAEVAIFNLRDTHTNSNYLSYKLTRLY